MNPRTDKTLSALAAITGLLVLFLAVAAFRLSFDALRSLAVAHSVKAGLAWLFPLVIDGFIVVASLSVVVSSLLSERVYVKAALVFAAVAVSTFFNVSHADGDRMTMVVNAVPPVALFLSFELLMSQLRAALERRGALMSLASLQRQFADRRKELSDELKEAQTAHEHALSLTDTAQKRHDGKLAQMRQEREALRGEIRELSEMRDDLTAGGERRQARIVERHERVLELAQSGASVSDIASEVGVSERTVYRDFDALDIGHSDNGAGQSEPAPAPRQGGAGGGEER